MLFKIFLFLSFVSFINCACFVPHDGLFRFESRSYFFCFREKNFTRKLQQLPTSCSSMGLAYSEIPKLKNNVFAERGSRLHNIAIIASGLSEIEDQALNSLKLLESLILSQNKLRVVKSVWFKDTPLLDTLILKKNQISHVDKDIGRFLPNLQTLDLEENHLTCLHSDVLSGLPKIQRLYFIYANPITDKCRQQSIQVFENMMANNRNVTFLKGYLENVVNGIDYTKECLKNLSSSAADESIKNCMNSKGDEALKEVLKTVGH